MKLEESYLSMLHRWDKDTYPKLVYVETTNFCNARCSYCLYERMERPIETMSFEQFKFIADKVHKHGIKIGAMFCFGEPLSDRELFKKIRYGRSKGVLTRYLGLNTNSSLLTPDLYDEILENTSNMTLSFPNTCKNFEKMTMLNWDKCYSNAIDFITYRDKHKPNFKIEIGCNDVTGHDRNNVKDAFKGYKVDWARDAEIKWASKVITGVIDRSIMYNSWTCDGFKGAMQIKPNGDCCFCAYDVIRTETKFANIFKDDWKTIEANFKKLWKRPASLCLRCDFWWNYYQMIDGGWKRGDHIDDSWQEAYNDSREVFWQDNHMKDNRRFLTGTKGEEVFNFLEVKPKGINYLVVGIGQGGEVKYASDKFESVYGLDITPFALEGLELYITRLYTNPNALPYDMFDLVTSHLVAQHMDDDSLREQIRLILRSMTEDGIFALQYASPMKDEIHIENAYAQEMGLVRRTKEDMCRIVSLAGGKIVHEVDTRYFKKATDDACWNGCHIKRDKFVNPIGY